MKSQNGVWGEGAGWELGRGPPLLRAGEQTDRLTDRGLWRQL